MRKLILNKERYTKEETQYTKEIILKVMFEIISISLLEEWEELNMYDSVATNAITNSLLFGPSTLEGINDEEDEGVEV